MDLAVACYAVTAAFPKDEVFGLTSQIRRSASSIPANIAEGHGREQTKSFIQYLRIAQGSLKELETHLLLSERTGLAVESDVAPLLELSDEIGRMLRSMIRKLQEKI